MNKITAFFLFLLIPLRLFCQSQDVYQDYREAWLRKGEQYKPVLCSTIVKPKQVVEIIEDGSSYQMNSYCHPWSCTPVHFIRKYNAELF